MRNRKQMVNYQPYYPNGQRSPRGGEVLKSSDIEYSGEIFEGCNFYHEWVYFEDINAEIHSDEWELKIIDLRNAMFPGRECPWYSLRYMDERYHRNLTPELIEMGVKTMGDLYKIIQKPLRVSGFDYITGTYPAIRTYSPFVKVKPIKAPKKWTKTQVWRAILSGQIYRGVIDRYDTEDNYVNLKGVEFSYHGLIGTASQLIESGNPYSIESTENGDGTVIVRLLGINSSYSLYFDPACDLDEGERRRLNRKKEMEAQSGGKDLRHEGMRSFFYKPD